MIGYQGEENKNSPNVCIDGCSEGKKYQVFDDELQKGNE